MKRTFILTALMLFVLTGIQAQSLEKVLEKHYEATSVEEIAGIETFDIKAKVSMMGMDMPMSIKVKKPDKFRVDMELMGQKTISAYDGKSGWAINPMLGEGVKDLEGEQLKQAMNQADMEGELYDYKAKGFSVEMLGKEDKAYKIKLTDKDGVAKTYFINSETYLVDKVTAQVKAMGQTMDVTTRIVEYQQVEGMKMAKRIEVETPMGTQSISMDEIKVNQKLDDSIFARPAN